MAGLIEKALKDLAESNSYFEKKVRENKAIALLKAAKAELKDEGKTVGSAAKAPSKKRKRKEQPAYQSDSDDDPPPSPAAASAARAAAAEQRQKKAK